VTRKAASILTVQEAATSLGLDPSTIRWQIKKGKLRADKLGRDWVILDTEVERYRVASRRAS